MVLRLNATAYLEPALNLECTRSSFVNTLSIELVAVITLCTYTCIFASALLPTARQTCYFAPYVLSQRFRTIDRNSRRGVNLIYDGTGRPQNIISVTRTSIIELACRHIETQNGRIVCK
jgi:hypothetical protein